MNQLERTRAKQQQRASATPLAKTPLKLKLPPTPTKPEAPSKPAPETLMMACGHAIEVDVSEIQAGQLENFLVNKAKNPCPSCREAAASAKKANRAGPERLPHGARFEVRYDGLAVEWSGALFVPIDGQEAKFQGVGPTLFGLQRKLDDCYRRNVKSQANRTEGVNQDVE
jgi:hypothetical protein